MNFDNETVEKRFLDFVWNRSMLKLVIKQFPENNPFNSKKYREVLHRRKPIVAA